MLVYEMAPSPVLADRILEDGEEDVGATSAIFGSDFNLSESGEYQQQEDIDNNFEMNDVQRPSVTEATGEGTLC